MEVLTNKRYRQYDTISRYSAFPIYYNNEDNKWVTGTTAYLKNDTSYNNYEVIAGDTYDNLALFFYNNPTLYWVICSFNQIADPFKEPEVGTILRIPVLSNITYED